jgi:aldehyde dehydrogenase (NAD+)
MRAEAPTAEHLAPENSLSAGVLGNHIEGHWHAAVDGDFTAVINPADPDQPLLSVARSGSVDAARALHVASTAQTDWSSTPPLVRAAVLRRAADVLRDRADTVALAMTLEEGKPLPEATAEVQRAAELIDATAGLAYAPQGEVYGSRRAEQWLMTRRGPLGVAVVIAPWNFPLLIPAWKIAPALLGGNTVVLKPAELTPLCAAHLVDAFLQGGLPAGVLNMVCGSGSRLGPDLLRSPAVAVSFTGGNEAGAAVARAAIGEHMKFQLELGGNNPVLVLGDADLDVAAREIVAGVVSGTGQKCTATRRIYVDRPVVAGVLERVRSLLADARLAPGVDPDCTVGPLVSDHARADFLVAAERVETVADVERFGELPDDGFFVTPILAVNGDPEAEIFGEEIFGPLCSLFPVDGIDEGIRRCNQTRYGLSASLFTGSLKAAIQFCDCVDAGMIHVNSQTTGAEPHLPFGGTKLSSSYSREVGRHGLEFFSQLKTMYLEGN